MNEREVENLLEGILKIKGWNDNVGDTKRDVYRRSPRTKEEVELLRNNNGNVTFPDYILYQSDKIKRPIAIIEVKKPKHKNLIDAKEQGMEYAKKLKANFLFLFNKNTCKAIHVPTEKYLIKDDDEVNEILSLEELLSFEENILKDTKATIQTKQDLISIFDKVNNKLREAGITVGVQRFSEFSNLLFLKLVSELNSQMEYQLPDKVLWDTFKEYKGESLLAYINDTVIPNLNSEFKSFKGEDGLFTSLKIKDPLILESIIKTIDSLTLNNVDTDIKGDAFEYFIQKYNQRNNDLGEYFTPRHIVKFLVNVLNPKLYETIYDPFCGTGGMLISSFKFIYDQLDSKGFLTKKNLTTLKSETLYGSEISETAKIAKMNMILTGDGHSNVIQQDTFMHPVKNKHDVILTNIPFNLNVTDKQKEPYKLYINSGNAVAIQHVLMALRKDSSTARAAVIIPEGVLTTDIYKLLREELVKSGWLDGIISLPPNVFLPYTEAKTSILIISGKAAPKNKDIYFYRIKNDGFTLTTRRRPIRGINDLDEFISLSQLINTDDLSKIVSDSFKVVSRCDILKNENISLQSVHYHDDDKDGFIRLSDIIERVKTKNILQYPTATINNSSFWGVDLGEEYWGENFVSVTSDTNIDYNVLAEKEICFNPSRANVGSFGINMSETKVSVSKAYPVYKITDNEYLPEYVYLQMMYNAEVKEDIITRCYGTVRQSLSVNDFGKIQIPIKTKKEQKKIVDTIVEKINEIQKLRSDFSEFTESLF